MTKKKTVKRKRVTPKSSGGLVTYDDGVLHAQGALLNFEDNASKSKDLEEILTEAVRALNASGSVEAMVGFQDALIVNRAIGYLEGTIKPDFDNGIEWAELVMYYADMRQDAIRDDDAKRASDGASALHFLSNQFQAETNREYTTIIARRDAILSTGRRLGTASRQKKYAEHYANIEQAIAGLFKSGEALKMGKPMIMKHLDERGFFKGTGRKKDSSKQKLVNVIIARHKVA